MRKQVNSLPKTKSGAPSFERASKITWPYFTQLLFMKEEFIGPKILSGCQGYAPNTEEKYGEKYDKQRDEKDLLLQEPECSKIAAARSRWPRRASAASTSEASQLNRKKNVKACYDNIELEKLKLLKESHEMSKQMMEEEKDPLHVFVMDLVNDLKQIKDKKLLVQTKLELKQITSNTLLRQMGTACAEKTSAVMQSQQVNTSEGGFWFIR